MNLTLTTINFADPVVLIADTLRYGSLLSLALLAIFAWITTRKIGLLNRTLHTNLATPLVILSTLFFLITVGTLVFSVFIWIKPLI